MTLPALKESHKICIMSTLLIGASYVTYYYHAVLDTDIIFTHLFYIPITLACIWWQRRGIVVALFFGAMLLVSHALFVSNFSLIHDVFRSLMFVAAAVVSSAVERTTGAGQHPIPDLSRQLPYGNLYHPKREVPVSESEYRPARGIRR